MLLASFDLRFTPAIESLYWVYYAQAKRGLLPTAIRVSLLVNLLLLLATCINFLVRRTILIVPLLLQLIVLAAAYAIHRSLAGQDEGPTTGATSSSEALPSDSACLSPLIAGHDDHEASVDVDVVQENGGMMKLRKRQTSESIRPNRDIDCEAGIAPAGPQVRGSSISGGSDLNARKRYHVAYVLWLCQLIQLSSGLWPQQSFISYSILLLYSYTIYVILPIRLTSCVLLSLALNLSQTIADLLLTHTIDFASTELSLGQQASNNNNNNMIEERVGTNWPSSQTSANLAWIPMSSHWPKLIAYLLLTLGINIIGVMSFYFYERQQRAVFLETRQSLETKLTLEQESQEQERLLLSILPEHLASEIRQDLGAVVTGQFKKIYMSRHENVSILFADIVGFTAISSRCQAAELVKTLNELFARFDKLAEKYHQLRIKILGDCYYAISGAPQERADHAVLSVHMGLSMVDAIRSVREKTKSTVDMRVGVHTGAVLAGVLGQRQWQFDVYSKDVELANKMESSGLPGRVHISNATLSFLNDEFEVSEADGESREEALRLANIKTYFIERVKKPYPEGTLDANLVQKQSVASSTSASQLVTPYSPVQSSNQRSSGSHSKTSGRIQNQHGSVKVSQRKQRNDSFNIESQIKRFSLNFANPKFERQFRSSSDITSCISLVALPLTLLCAFAGHLCLFIVQPEVTLIYAGSCLLMLLVVLVCILPYLLRRADQLSAKNNQDSSGLSAYLAADSQTSPTAASHVTAPTAELRLAGNRLRCQRLSRFVVLIADAVKQSAWMKLALTALMTFAWLIAHSIAASHTVYQLEQSAESSPRSIRLFTVDIFNYFAIACSLAVTAVTRISFLVKTILIIIVILLQVLMNLSFFSKLLTWRLNGDINFNSRNNTKFFYPDEVGAELLQKNSTSSGSIWNNILTLIGAPFSRLDAQHYDQCIFTLTLLTICWALLLINRQFELNNRRLFLWRKQVEERKEKVSDLRRKNEALVYNILPPNVAKIFLGKRIINDDELYSKSYEAVGVLFAAMPNFSDFYTEESVNNQGLECLRFLNEVISDYDALLDQSRFENIIKIKTMGPTYMAASGLFEGDALALEAARKTAIDPSQELPDQVDLSISDSSEQQQHQARIAAEEQAAKIRKQWGHLKQLTEFALALKDTLNNINKESFNNFVLRIGINHGPITAGVIGVKKPHFDMWGNTVNVASRMESTGKAGSIQVVEETANILRHFGFRFDQRGSVSVKGKGKLMTYYLIG